MSNAQKHIEEEASGWLSREDHGLGENERAALAEWLEKDTRNRVSYLELKAVWRRADRLRVLHAPGQCLPSTVRPHRGTQLWRIAAALLLVLAAGTGGALFLRNQENWYATGIGETQNIRLADGTDIQLNTNTRLSANESTDGRVVKLDHGEAYFDVVHDRDHPFVVLAGNRKITDIGTKFTVRKVDDSVDVMIVEGSVKVEVLDGTALKTTIYGKAGDVVVARKENTLVTSSPRQSIENGMSWRRGQLVFDLETLAGIAQEFNRYNQKQMIVVGRARDIRIGGSFRATNPEAFAGLIQKGLGLKVEETNTSITISK